MKIERAPQMRRRVASRVKIRAKTITISRPRSTHSFASAGVRTWPLESSSAALEAGKMSKERKYRGEL
jgi:hypothetical protein